MLAYTKNSLPCKLPVTSDTHFTTRGRTRMLTHRANQSADWRRVHKYRGGPLQMMVGCNPEHMEVVPVYQFIA